MDAVSSSASSSPAAVTKPTVVLPYSIDEYGLNKGAAAVSLGPAVDSVMQFLRQRVAIANIRTLFSCIGVGEATAFDWPPTNQVVPRLKANGNFFFTNYLLVTVTTFFFLLLFFHPIQLVVCIIVGFAWYLVLTKKQQELDHLVVFGKRIGEQELLLFTTATTIIFLVFFILPTILFSFSTSIAELYGAYIVHIFINSWINQSC
ncbi:hypothetical protein ATCC90586_002419 [Pythium insidiosum]|nr:hypothetical protein ATCC90586_002419 [Pythium insidiosum]